MPNKTVKKSENTQIEKLSITEIIFELKMTKSWLEKIQALSLIIWWLQVTVKPDNNKIKVFNNGIFKGFNTFIPKGGQIEPNSILGERLAWKKAQKKEKKNITSEAINKITPKRSPCCTLFVW